MPQYIKQEGEVIFHIDENGVKTPFFDKEYVKTFAKEYWIGAPLAGTFDDNIKAGILIPYGLCEKRPVCNNDCPDAEYGNCCHPSNCQKKIFAFIKESKPVEETNEEVTWSEFFAEFEKGKQDFYGRKNITSYLKSKFTITRK